MKKQAITLFAIMLLMSCNNNSSTEKMYNPDNLGKNQITLLKFVLDYGVINNHNATNELIKEKAYTVIYSIGEDGVNYLAVVWPTSGTQSFGKLVPAKPIEYDKRDSINESIIATYKWYYNNSFDDIKGVANVKLIYQNEKMSLQMVTDNSDTGIYKGYIVK